MNRGFFFRACFVSCLVISLGGCSLARSEKPAKEAKKPTVAESGNVEWKERKWENYAEDRGGVVFYFERESVTYPSKDLLHVWMLNIQKHG